MEGPLGGDKGKRIVVLHANQPAQCSNCLRGSTKGCPSLAVAKACEKTCTQRAKMNFYMDNLRKNVGYSSLKVKHAERQAKMFSSLLGFPGEVSSETELSHLWTMDMFLMPCKNEIW